MSALPLGWLVQASTFSVQEDLIFDALLLASALLLLVVVGLITVFLVRFRSGSSAPRTPLAVSEEKIEAGWICGTTVVFLGFFFWGAKLYLSAETPPPGAEEIHVVARQWMWDIRQPDGRREFDSLHVPEGVPVRLLMTSEDVIHSFYVPAFRLKQDVVPGKQTSLWFTATRTGSYRLDCTQFCGSKHSLMVGTVVVMAPGDYARWLERGPAPQLALAEGRRLFVGYGCAGCHTPGADVHAPRLDGLYGREVPQQDGSFRRVDDAYLRDCILQPETVWPGGYPRIMPSFKGVISEGDLLEIIAYIKAMGRGGAVSETRNLP